MWLGWCCVGTTSQMRVLHLWFLALAQIVIILCFSLQIAGTAVETASVLSAALSVLVSTILSFTEYIFRRSAWLVVEQCWSPSLHTTALDWNINQPSQPLKAVNERPAVVGFPRPPVEVSPRRSTHIHAHTHHHTHAQSHVNERNAITSMGQVTWAKQ